jgi:hypothetical protein
MKQINAEATKERLIRQLKDLDEIMGDQIVEKLKGDLDEAWAMKTKTMIESLQSELRTLSQWIDR